MSHAIRALALALVGLAWFWMLALVPGLFVVFFFSSFPLLWGIPLALAVLLWSRYGFPTALTAVGVGAVSTALGIFAFALRDPGAFY